MNSAFWLRISRSGGKRALGAFYSDLSHGSRRLLSLMRASSWKPGLQGSLTLQCPTRNQTMESYA